jgi:hypothetical protein
MQLRLDRLNLKVKNTLPRLVNALKKQVHKEFNRKQAVIDIKRKLSGTAINDGEAKEVLQGEDQMLPEQIYLLKKLLTWPTSHSLEDKWQWQNTAAKAVMQYCPVLEGGPLCGWPKPAMPSDGLMTNR